MINLLSDSKPTLLDKALAVPFDDRRAKKEFNRQHYELALALLLGQIKAVQFSAAIGERPCSAIPKAWKMLADGVASDEIRISLSPSSPVRDQKQCTP